MGIEKNQLISVLFMGASLFADSSSQAEIRPEQIYTADSKKNQKYIHEGIILGGDRSMIDIVVKDIRRAKNSGFERIVIDLTRTQNGEPTEIKHPPYYQLAVFPDERRFTLSLFGKPKLDFNPKKVLSTFKHSHVIQKVDLLPRLEDDSWTTSFELKSDSSVEVFELSQPTRIIIDVKPQKS